MKPTREAFLRDPRSRELRSVCLEMAAIVQALAHEADPTNERGYARLEHLNGRLVELGVTGPMHVGLPPEAFDDPVLLAEYLAGQLVRAAGQRIPSEGGMMLEIQEWGETIGTSGYRLWPEDLPQSLGDFASLQGRASLVKLYFDEQSAE